MTFFARFKFFIGIVLVLAGVAYLLLILAQNLSQVTSDKAEIGYDTYTVGTPYPGIIVKQDIKEGDTVKKGDLLFKVQSPTLTDDISKGRASASSFDLDSDGYLQIKASNDGVVTKIDFTQGSYISGTLQIATIAVDGTAYVKGEFKLAPPDYGRVNEGDTVKVLLPNNQTVNASVSDISVQNDNDQAVTVIKATLDQNLQSKTFASGTPVTATLLLSGKSFTEAFRDVITNLLTPQSQ